MVLTRCCLACVCDVEAGTAPSTAKSMIWYLAASRSGCDILWDGLRMGFCTSLPLGLVCMLSRGSPCIPSPQTCPAAH